MTFRTRMAAMAAGLMLTATSALASDIMVMDPYIRSSTPSSVTGAAFLGLMNAGETDDRLIAVSSDIASRVELHTHLSDENGVMKMMEIEGGVMIPAGETHMLKRGGDHIMFMGLNRPLIQGEQITLTLTFEKAGKVEVSVPVDHERRPSHGAMDHSSMKNSEDN